MTDTEHDITELYVVRRPKQPVRWEVDVPGSKSITNRALLLSALSEGKVKLEGVLSSDDSRAFFESLTALGFSVESSEEEHRIIVEGGNGHIPLKEAEIDVGSAGTAARFLTALLGVSEGTYRIQASPQMQKRPMRPLFEALLSLGAKITWLGEEWHLPVSLTGAAQMRARSPQLLELDISQSTQFLSAFLMTAPMFPDGLHIRITSEKKDGSYIRMTRKMMQEFGITIRMENGEYILPVGSAYKKENYQVEPDASAAGYFYGAAAVTGGYVRVNRIYNSSLQGDLQFLDVLGQMGCTICDEPDGIAVKGPLPGSLRGISVDMRDFSDQALTLAAIAPYADGPVKITGISHIRHQESDRIKAITENLRRAGISCEELPDGVLIQPGVPQPCRIETFDDHRVAMAFAVMGLGADGIGIDHPECCAKTFEDYFEILDSLINGYTKGDQT